MVLRGSKTAREREMDTRGKLNVGAALTIGPIMPCRASYKATFLGPMLDHISLFVDCTASLCGLPSLWGP